MTGCPRVDVHSVAVQLLQVLDKRFFGNVGPLQTEGEKGKEISFNIVAYRCCSMKLFIIFFSFNFLRVFFSFFLLSIHLL